MRIKKRYAMTVDTHRCVGCQACVLACKAENQRCQHVMFNAQNFQGPEHCLDAFMRGHRRHAKNLHIMSLLRIAPLLGQVMQAVIQCLVSHA